MLRGMTGYALVTDGHYSVEIHSVNKRHLDVRFNGPRALEIPTKKQVTERLSRGQITISIQSPLRDRLDQIAKELDLERKDAIALLPYYPDQIEADLIAPLVNQALDQVVAMRKKEGETIKRDLLDHLNVIDEQLGKIASLDISSKLKKRLMDRLKEVTDERIAQEVAIWAEKADITEEIVRLRYHLCELPKQGSGKTMEFITQEMLRETNTIGAKAQDIAVTQAVIVIKSELEKMREQLANVE